VKRLKRDLWTELEQTFANNATNKNEEDDKANNQDDDDADALSTASTVSDPDPVLAGTSGGDENNNDENSAAKTTTTAATTLSFQDTVRDMQMNESQSDVTLPFYFICILHLCNEKGLALESSGLDDFIIHSS